MSDADLPPLSRPSRGDRGKDNDNTDDIIAAIQRIMQAEEAILDSDPDLQMLSYEAQKRVFAALDRLTGGNEQQPTVLEALILEKLEPLLSDWLDKNLPALTERLVREEIRALLARRQASIALGEGVPADT